MTEFNKDDHIPKIHYSLKCRTLAKAFNNDVNYNGFIDTLDLSPQYKTFLKELKGVGYKFIPDVGWKSSTFVAVIYLDLGSLFIRLVAVLYLGNSSWYRNRILNSVGMVYSQSESKDISEDMSKSVPFVMKRILEYLGENIPSIYLELTSYTSQLVNSFSVEKYDQENIISISELMKLEEHLVLNKGLLF